MFTAKMKDRSTRGSFNKGTSIQRTFHADSRRLHKWKTFDVKIFVDELCG